MKQKPTSTTTSQVASVVNLPGYKIKDVLGKGGMAIVYLAVQESIGREVALKILVPDHSDESFTDRFLSEARIISSLNHPNIITVYDAGVHQGCHYMSMEYVPGKSLRDARDLLTRKEKVLIIKQVAQALDYAGKKGYVHRDIKPENILLHEDGRAILTDFGIARSLNVTRGLTVTGKTIGTPYYMSPEQTKGAKVDHRSDIYSLGVVLFQALAGYLPYDGPSLVAIGIKHISEPIPGLPAGLEIFQSVINIALSKDPAHRYTTAADFYHALDAISDADLDYVDAKVAALKKKGVDYHARTLSTSSSIVPEVKKSAHENVSMRAHRHSPAGALDITDTEEFKRLGRRRNRIIVMLLLVILAGVGFYQQDVLHALWQQHVQPTLEQLSREHATLQPESGKTPDATAPMDTTASTATDIAQTITTDASASPVNSLAQQPDILRRIDNDPALIDPLSQEYHALLVANPDDSTARLGLEHLGKWYILQIRNAVEQKQTTAARNLILQAKQNLHQAFVPPQLLVIEEQLLRQEAIQSHLDKAKQYFTRGQYLAPEGENARDEWLAVLSIDQHHDQAKQGIAAISQHYLELATSKYNATKYIEALAATEQGLSADKHASALIALKTRIEKEIEKQNRILALLIRAEAEFQAERIIKPQNDNAFDLYKQVLKEQPTNQKAHAGLLKIEEYLNRQINTAIWENKLKQASQLMSEALLRFPNSAKLYVTKGKLQKATQTRAAKVTHILFSDTPLSSLLKEQGTVTNTKTLYIGFTYTNLTKSTTLLNSKLIDQENNVISKKLIVSDKSGEHIFSMKHPRQQFSTGSYRFIIELDSKPMLDTTFNIETNAALP